MKTKEEIEQLAKEWLEKDVYGELLNKLELNECGEIELNGLKSGFNCGYQQCQEDMADVIKQAIEYSYHYDYVMGYNQCQEDMIDTIKQAIEYGYQLRCNNKPINSGIDWVKEFNSLNKQD